MTTKEAKAIAHAVSNLRGSMTYDEHTCVIREISRAIAECCPNIDRDAFERQCNA